MSALKRAWARLLSMFRSDALDRDFDTEAQSHLALAADDYIRDGMSAEDAQRLARLRFGSLAASREVHRESRSLPSVEAFLFDLRLTLRGLRRDPGFTLAAIAMLALAIGLNVTVFAVMHTMLFRGYPLVQGNDRLVYIQERYPSGRCCISYRDFEEWRAQARTFDGMAFVGARSMTLRDGRGRPVDMTATVVSANTFGLLGVPPMLGRDFAPADEVPGAAPVAILDYDFWASRFDKRADVIGSTVQIQGEPTTIIGVMPQRFDFPTKEDLWMPVAHTPELWQWGLTPRGFMAVARRRDGVTIQESRAELETINRRLEVTYPTTNRGVVPTVATHSETNSGRDARIIWGSLWVAACFVLVIACANVANLLLVRTVGHWREFSTKIALGSGLGRIARQIGVESLMLAGVAGTFGWWITTWSVRRWDDITVSRYQVLDYTVDSGTLAYLVALSAIAALLCSMAPIGRVLQFGARGTLTGDARGVTQGLRGKRVGAGLVAAQMALAIVLLSGAGVIVRSFTNIVGAESGVRDPERILVGAMRLPSDKYPTPSAQRTYFDRVETRLKTVPAILEQSLATTVPVKTAVLRTIEIEGRPRLVESDHVVQFVRAGANYFRVVGVAATSGRTFTDGDQPAALPVAIVNESFAAKYWPGEHAVGRRLRARSASVFGPWLTVVGVVPNIMQGDALRQQFKPLVYVPFAQEPAPRFAFFLLRTNEPADRVAPAVRAAVEAVDADVALEEFGTLEASFAFDRDFMDADHSELGKHAKVAPVFAIIALLLSATGLSAVIAHSIGQRTKEIGVRMAIGATARDIRRIVVREGMGPVTIGLVVGLAASVAMNRILRSQLVGVSPYDPLTLFGASALLIALALLACRIPARRAMAVDPVVALKCE